MKIKNSMRLAAWLAVFALLMLSAAAATLDEMYENGVVADGNVRFGDARDGVVSDVSGPMPPHPQRLWQCNVRRRKRQRDRLGHG